MLREGGVYVSLLKKPSPLISLKNTKFLWLFLCGVIALENLIIISAMIHLNEISNNELCLTTCLETFFFFGLVICDRG